MLINRLITRLVLGASLLTAGAALPVIAQAHDNDGGGRGYHGRNHDHGNRPSRHWDNRAHHWVNDYPRQIEERVYERRYVQPRVYYSPAYVYPRPTEGVTIIYRNRW
ncbi:MAG: hypothetical protein V4568_09600 [Pseudomonadota bacterium]